MPNELTTIEELLHAFLDLEHPEAPDSPISRTPECLTFQQLAGHANGTRFLAPAELRHVNRCPDYCQSLMKYLRTGHQTHCMPDVVAGQRLAALDSSPDHTEYECILCSRDGQKLGLAKLAVTDGPFITPSGYVVFRVSVLEPQFFPELFPLQICVFEETLLDQPLATFDLPSQTDEIVKLKVGDGDGALRLADIDTTGRLPFMFTVTARGSAALGSFG